MIYLLNICVYAIPFMLLLIGYGLYKFFHKKPKCLHKNRELIAKYFQDRITTEQCIDCGETMYVDMDDDHIEVLSKK